MAKQSARSANGKAQTFDLKRVLQRHHHLVTFVGAVIVFLTFVARDGIREQLKDFVASLDTAENMFVLREGNQFTESRIAELTRNFKVFFEESHKSKSDDEWFEEKLDNELQLVQVDLVELANRINNVERILGKAPNHQDEQDLRPLKEELNDAYDKWSGFYKVHDAGPQSILDLRNLDLVVAELSLNITHLEGRMLNHARERKAVKEEHYKWATWASYFFYTLGLGLGLIGRVYGVEGVGEDG